jgi:hypothetical protein
VSRDDDQLVADYLQRLRAAAGALPADRRDELVDEISAHIAEARATGPVHAEASPTYVRNVLERLGDPDDIVNAAAESGGSNEATYDAGTGETGRAGETGGAAAEGYGLDESDVRDVPGADGPGGNGPGGNGPGANGPGGNGPGEGWSSGYGAGGGGSLAGGAMAAGFRGGSGPGVQEIIAVILLLIGGFLAGIGWVVGVVLLWSSPRWRTSDKVLGTLIWPGGLALPALALVVFGAIGSHTSVCANPVSSVAVQGVGGRVAVRENVHVRSPLGSVSVNGGNRNVSGPGGQVSVRDGHTTVTGPRGNVSTGNPVSHHAASGTSCSLNHPGLPWLVIGLYIFLLIVAVCAPVLVSIGLLRRARRAPAQPTPEPAQLQPV